MAKHAATFTTDFACNICEFQIAKDGDAMVSGVTIAAPQHACFTFYTYNLQFHYNFNAATSGTDPPLFV